MSCLAMVCGCAGLTLTPYELAFIGEADPWGLILFRRNVDSPDQVRRLTADFRSRVGRADAPVLVDQEGGRVQRLGPPHWRKYPAGGRYLTAAKGDLAAAADLACTTARLIGDDLAAVGITVDCAPVLDVPDTESHGVIGDRAYAPEAEAVSAIGRAFAGGLLDAGIVPVLKHVPGHGRGRVDSHHELPVVDADRETLEAVDFLPFRALAGLPAAMTAHVVFTAIDPDRPATTSPRVVREIIRGAIGFTGLLFSDDLSMNALSGSLAERARAAAGAGIDVLLHCNGKLDEAGAVAGEAPPLEGDAARRAKAALQAAGRSPTPFDAEAAIRKLDRALAAA